MAPVSRFFQASFSAALAIALLVMASPARSETIDLACVGTNEGNTNTVRLLIDTNLSRVTEIWSSGKPYPFTASTMSDQFIRYFDPAVNDNQDSAEITIDRFAGIYVRENKTASGKYLGTSRYACRRATQKF